MPLPGMQAYLARMAAQSAAPKPAPRNPNVPDMSGFQGAGGAENWMKQSGGTMDQYNQEMNAWKGGGNIAPMPPQPASPQSGFFGGVGQAMAQSMPASIQAAIPGNQGQGIPGALASFNQRTAQGGVDPRIMAAIQSALLGGGLFGR